MQDRPLISACVDIKQAFSAIELCEWDTHCSYCQVTYIASNAGMLGIDTSNSNFRTTSVGLLMCCCSACRCYLYEYTNAVSFLDASTSPDQNKLKILTQVV